jgi:uncharacterized membrane protein
MEKRPKIQLPFTKTDKVLEALSYLLLLTLWIFAVYVYQNSPDIIPTHFNGAGDADGYGSKTSVFMAAGACTLIFILLTYFSTKVHAFNYPTEITPENAAKQYSFAARMLRSFKVIIPTIFICIEYSGFEVVTAQREGLAKGFILLIFALVYIPVLYFIAKASSAPDSKN